MPQFEFKKLDLEGLQLISPFYMEDERGYFQKNYEREIFRQNGIELDISEILESSSHKNTLRGLHFQVRYPQAKLIRVLSGEIFDVAVDLRKNSPTFGQWASFTLSRENHKNFYIPPGFAHGFLTLSDEALVSYCCVGKYYREYDSGIIWNDTALAINWPIKNLNELIVSDKDQKLMTFEEFEHDFGGLYEYPSSPHSF